MNIHERLASLFKRGDREPVDPFVQLIRIADGKAKFPYMSKKDEEEAKNRYGNSRIAHQLRAIKQLGESGRQEALDYLKRFYEEVTSSVWTDGTYMAPDYHYYPNAKGPLRNKLEWTDDLYDQSYPQSSEPHKTIQTAISNLEKQLNP